MIAALRWQLVFHRFHGRHRFEGYAYNLLNTEVQKHRYLMRKKEDCSASLAIRQHGGFLAIDRYR
jgi:hypothetical protein